MKKRFFVLLLSAILLLSLLPFVFASSADDPVAPTGEGVVQGPDDTVIIMESGAFGTTAVNFQAATKKAAKTGRTIFVLAYDYQLVSSNANRTFIVGDGWQDATLTFTSKVKIMYPERTYTASSSVSNEKTLVDPEEYPEGTVLDYFKNNDSSNNVTLTSPGVSLCWLDSFCNVEFDYLNFKCGNENFFFYANYFDITFGEHFLITPFSDPDTPNHYPSLVNGLDSNGVSVRAASKWANKEADASVFTKTQTIKILGGTWFYITPSYRATPVTVSGTINLILKNVETKADVSPAGLPRTTLMMGRDAYTSTAKVNVTIEGCTFARFAFFAATLDDGSEVRVNAGKLSVTLNGNNIFTNGIENIHSGKDFKDVFDTAGAALTLTVNGSVTLGENKTIDGLGSEIANLKSTVRYDKTKADPDLLINFDEKDDEFSPIVQGENDAVVFLGNVYATKLDPLLNQFADNKVKTSDTTEHGPYDRIIVCLTQPFSFPASTNPSNSLFDSFANGGSTAYYASRAGYFLGNELAATACREQIVFTSYVIVTDTDKVFSAEATSSTVTVTKDTSKAATSYDYYTDETVLMNLTGTSSTPRYVALCSDVIFDYIRFRVVNENATPIFYLQYNNAVFGRHYQIISNGENGYPVLMQGQQYGRTYSSASEYKFTEWSSVASGQEPLRQNDTQTVEVLGGTWAYISLRNRGTYARNLTYIRGTINLTLENVKTVSTDYPSALMAHDIYGSSSRINATIRNCTFSQFGFFETCLMNHSDKQLSGSVSVTFEGTNTFTNGILGVAPHSTYTAVLTSARLLVTNNGTITLGSEKTINGAHNYDNPTNYSMFFNYGTTVDTTVLTGFNTYEKNDHGAVVYWNMSIAADDDSWGLDEDHPTKQLENALEYLRGTPQGYGTVKMVGSSWISASDDRFIFPDFRGHELYIEAELDEKGKSDYLLVLVGPYYWFNSPVTFKNINFARTTSVKGIWANDYDVTFDNCGYYVNDGGYTDKSNPVKGDAVTTQTKTLVLCTRGSVSNPDYVASCVNLNQTIKITGNSDSGFALRRICAAYKDGLTTVSGTYYAPDTDESTGCDGNVNIVVGENATVQYIDTIANEANDYKVNVTLPNDLIKEGKVQIKTENANKSSGITMAIYVRGDSGTTTLQQTAPNFSKQGTYGYSLRGLNSSEKYAMRAGFKVPVSDLTNAVEYGVLVKRHGNTRPFVWFEGSGGVNKNKIGKSVVYLPDLPEPIDNRWIVTEEEVEYSTFTAPLTFAAGTLNSAKAANKYDFDPYVVYGYTFGGTTVRCIFYGSESDVSIEDVSLQDMIDVCAASGKPVATALAAEISDVITDNG